MELNEIMKRIKPADKQAEADCLMRFDAVAKPLGGLGKLEMLIAKIAGIQSTPNIDIAKKCALVFCADNGVTAQGVTQCSSDVTTSIAKMLALKKSSVCSMAKACGADVFAVDVGMNDSVSGIINEKIACGTNDISTSPAMSREQTIKAILIGANQVCQRAKEGYKLMAIGEAGIGNTTTAAAVAAVLLGENVQNVTGRGSGLSDDGLNRKQSAIKKAIELNKPDASDPIDILAKVGGYDIAAMCGAFLAAAAYKVTLVVDGVISSAAALAAVRMNETVLEYIIPSHISREPASVLLCSALGFDPVINGGFKLGEGTGAVALFPLLDMAVSVYENSATFADLEMETYTKQC